MPANNDTKVSSQKISDIDKKLSDPVNQKKIFSILVTSLIDGESCKKSVIKVNESLELNLNDQEIKSVSKSDDLSKMYKDTQDYLRSNAKPSVEMAQEIGVKIKNVAKLMGGCIGVSVGIPIALVGRGIHNTQDVTAKVVVAATGGYVDFNSRGKKNTVQKVGSGMVKQSKRVIHNAMEVLSPKPTPKPAGDIKKEQGRKL